MFNDFGNVNDMTRGQFNTAIEYYRNRINAINEDASISKNTKLWFIETYQARIKSLESTLSSLNEAINAAKSSGALINDETTSLSKLGRTSTSTGNFDNYSQNARKHKVSQRWKILGACLLPVVGTIPFLISWKRAKKRHKDINTKIAQENIELGNFVNHEKRPYEKTLLTSTKFTEAEMINLLEDTTELTRIETLALTGAISPIEKTNLTKKLVELREFAQKNGYPLIGVLSNPAFRTKTDKTDIKITAHETTYNSTPATATNLKDAYDAIKKLQDLRAEVQTLYNETRNSRLETLLNNIDSRIATLKGNAKTAIENGVNDIVANVNAVVAATNDEPGYTAAIASVEARATATNTNFGTGVNIDQARKMAEEIGFDDQTDEYIKFSEVENARSNKKSGFETELNKVKGETELRTNIANNLAELERVLTQKLDPLSPIDEVNIKEAFIYLAEAKSAYDFLNQTISNLNAAEKTRFDALRTRYLAHELNLNNKNQEFASKAENFDSYKTEINGTIDITKDKDTLSGELELLKSTLATIESDEYKAKMNKIGLGSELNRLISTAKSKITKYEKLISQKEAEEENTKLNNEVRDTLTDNSAILNPILSLISSSALPTDLIELDSFEQQINGVISALSGITGTLDPTNKGNLRTLNQNARNALVAVKKQIQAVKKPKELENYYKSEIEKVELEAASLMTKLTSAKTKTQSLNQLSLCVAKLKRLKNEAISKGVSLDFDSLIDNIENTIASNPLGPTAP